MTSNVLPPDVSEALTALADPQPMRRGSLGERFMKCGKPACACHTDDKARHGPYFVLTRAVQHTTRSRFLSATQSDLARKQVERAAQFREQLELYWQACERWADNELELSAADTQAAKKGASRKPLRRRLSRRSTRS